MISMRNHVGILLAVCVALVCPAASPADSQSSTYIYTGQISFDIAKVPFSRNGSYVAISQMSGDASSKTPSGLYLRSMRHGQRRIFLVELLADGLPVPFQANASPTLLHLQSEAGSADICLPREDQMRLRGEGVSLRLTAENGALAIPNGGHQWEINSPPNGRFRLLPIDGSLDVDAPWSGTRNSHVVAMFVPDPGTHRFAGEIDDYESVWDPHPVEGDFDAGETALKREYHDWLERMPEVLPEYGPGAELAAYVNWASVVAPSGFFTRPAMLMSKNWMANVWSWDHCFNAMALAYKAPELAWQQFELPFDNQDAHGALPDRMGDSSLSFDFFKPPVHGWALLWMMQNGGYRDPNHQAEIYGPLARWTEWYFKYRDSNRNGFPEYIHGNDSGWDNSTVMLAGVPVETPDLDSFLILQMQALSSVAQTLGKDQEARAWKTRSDQLLAGMLAKFWKGDHFVAFRAEDGAEVDSDSLILYLPLILGRQLPPEVRDRLVSGLMKQGRFRTSHGFASEALTSKHYSPDGYWLGPIWAPPTLMLAEGLDGVGEHQLAKNLREDFCKMAQQSGMSENYDAVTGAGLRDPAYTWTSSVYLILAHQLWEGEHGKNP